MKKIFLLLFIGLFLASCSEYIEEKSIKSLINGTYVSTSKQLKDVEIIKEDLYSLPYSSLMSKEITKEYSLEKGNEYQIVRYIYKTKKGAYRMFYFLDLTDKSIIDKSSDPDDFFVPIHNIIFEELDQGFDRDYIVGQNTFELFRY